MMDKCSLAAEGILKNVAILSQCSGKPLPQSELKGLEPTSLRAIELDGKWAFLLFGHPAQIKAQVAALKSIYLGDITYCAQDIQMADSDRKYLEKIGVSIIKSAADLYLYGKRNIQKGVRCVVLTHFLESPLAKELSVFNFESMEIPIFEFGIPAFQRSIHLNSIETWMAPFLKELFTSKDYAEPFHYESNSTENDALKGVLSCAKKVDNETFVSVPKAVIEKIFANSNPEVDSVCDWKIEADRPITSKDIYIGEFVDDESAYEELLRLSKLEQKPKRAYIVVQGYSVLPFFEASLSKKVGFPIKAFNILSPIFGGLMEFLEDWKKRILFNSYICHKKGSVFPFSERDIFTGKDKDAREFSPLTFFCAYSIYPYLDAYEGKKEQDLAGSVALPIFKAIKREELIPSEWFYADLLKTYNDPESLLFRFANHEHVMWARRTCLYRDSKDFAKRLSLIKPLSEFANILGEKANEEIAKDYYASIPFLFEVVSNKRRQFDPIRDLAEKPIDLDRLVSETNITGKQLEGIIAESEPSEIKVSPCRVINESVIRIMMERVGPSKEGGGIIFFLCGQIDFDNYPAPGDIIEKRGLENYVVLYAYDIRKEERWVSNVDSIGGLGEIVECPCKPSTIVAAIITTALTPLSSAGGTPRNLPILYVAPYWLNSAAGVLMRKRVSDTLKIGENGKKAFQTPIISKIPLKKAPFTLNFDYRSLYSYRMVFANSFDEYRNIGTDISEDIFRLVRSFKLPEVEFPYRDYDEEYGNNGLTLHSVPEVSDPDDPDIDPDQTILPPNVLPLPYPVIHRSMLPALARLLYLEEEDGFALGEGRLFFDKKALLEKKIAFTADPSLGEKLEPALPQVFEILKDPNGEMMQRALREFSRYPFGERKERMLLYRLAKLGVFSEKAFFHSYIPVSANCLVDIFDPCTAPDIYMLSTINAGADILKMKEQGETEVLKKALEKHANECFDCLLFAHLRLASKARLIERSMSTLNSKLYEVWLKCDGRESRADLADAIFGACGGWCLKNDGCADILIYMALFAQYVSKDKCVDLFLSDASGDYKKLEEISKKYEGLLSFDVERFSTWRISEHSHEISKEQGKSIRFAPPGREEAKFEVLAATYFLRRIYYVVSPWENLGYITPNSCLVLIKRQFGEGYDLETSTDNIDMVLGLFD